MTPAAPIIIKGTVGAEGTLRATWQFNKGQLAFMKTRDRNALFRNALVNAMTAWRAAFIPQRFTPYVKRSPFSYSLRGGEVAKAMASLGLKRDGTARPGVGGHGPLAVTVRGIMTRETDGWNPWGPTIPPMSLMQRMADREGRKKPASFYANDARAYGKKRLTEAFRNLYADGVMEPLVLTGDLRAGAMNGKVSATATSNKLVGRVTVPFPGPRNARVSQIIRTVPHWEVGYIIRQFKAAIESSRPEAPVSRSAPTAQPRQVA
jgi:hypothetical protein